MPAPGLILAAPSSGSGKTLLTLALLRHFRNRGIAVGSVKVGPDYIDPAYHAAASGVACRTLDAWAMRPETFAALARAASRGCDFVLGEGVMGLFDGAVGGGGSTAEVAALTGWPVVLVIDARGLGASAAAMLHGFATYRPDTAPAGVIFNRVASPRHGDLLRAACAPLGIPVLGCVPRDDRLVVPSRHLGLVQAGEADDLDGFLETAAAVAAAAIDGDALLTLARPGRLEPSAPSAPIPPLGQRIAIARDEAFAFAYPHVLDGWSAAGSDLTAFSPLADDAPPADADAVYLPGGYPELHAARLACNGRFLDGMRAAAARGAVIYGECGGYMVLGRALTDAQGEAHAMTGLLPLETSFAAPRRTLGYRTARVVEAGPLGAAGAAYRGHEFHYATITAEDGTRPLFDAGTADGRDLGRCGARSGTVLGSFLHLIDRA